MRVGRRGFAVCFCLVSCLSSAFGQPTNAVTSLVQETSNNTSACSSSSDPGGLQSYCTAAFNGFSTNPSDTGAETQIPVSSSGHVSNVSIKQLLYPGWNGKVICEYQPWFGASNHKSIGYNENSPATAAAQDSYMLSVGCDINLIDFYGSLDPSQSFNLATTSTVFADVNNRTGYPLKFGIMEDKNALTYSCPTSGQAEAATVTCLENALISDMDYVNSHYTNSGVYFTDGGEPVIFSFVTQSVWPILTAADWNTIWSTLKAHTDTYAAPFKYIFEFGAFTSAAYDNGRYAWMQPPAYSSAEQFWWGSITSLLPTYLDTFYTAGLASPNQITVGGLWKGFDDNNASWSGNRVIAEQCGQVLLNTANEIVKYFGTANQLPYVQVATWNDYEEGTAVETGIDNCYTVNASISGTQVNWSLVASDSYASPATIHHFNIYYVDSSGNLYSAASNIAPGTSSLDLSSLIPSGTWSVYVEMVGQPLIINRMSNAVTFAHGAGGGGTDFSLSATPSSRSISAGSSASYNISVVSVGSTFAGEISLSCGGLPADSTCAFSPVSVNAGTSTALVITTKASQSAKLQRDRIWQRSPAFAVVLSFGSFGVFGLVIVGGRKRKQRAISVLVFVGLLLLCGLATSCSGASTGSQNNVVIPGTPSGSYNVTVTAASGTLTHNTQLTLVVK